MAISLEKLVVPTKEVSFEVPGYDGFEVVVAYMTRDELMKIREKATTKKMNRKANRVEDIVDPDIFQDLYIKSVIKGWKGFKYKYMEKLLPVDLSDVEDLDAEHPYSTADAVILMKNSSTFDSWITELLDDVANFSKSS